MGSVLGDSPTGKKARLEAKDLTKLVKRKPTVAEARQDDLDITPRGVIQPNGKRILGLAGGVEKGEKKARISESHHN